MLAPMKTVDMLAQGIIHNTFLGVPAHELDIGYPLLCPSLDLPVKSPQERRHALFLGEPGHHHIFFLIAQETICPKT